MEVLQTSALPLGDGADKFYVERIAAVPKVALRLAATFATLRSCSLRTFDSGVGLP